MNWYKQVHKLQIDLTSHCNARCGACIRNVNGNEIKPGLELKHFDLDVWKRITTEDTKGWYISHLSLNGNWGDAVMHPDLLEIVREPNIGEKNLAATSSDCVGILTPRISKPL